ncbi:hypothetical protein N9W21_07640 [Shewanella sp.]|nr:hypothetical protein [Shewanella sp.]
MPSRNNSALHFSKRQSTLTSALKLTALIGINCALSSNVFADNENVSAANSSTTSHWSGYVSATATSNVFRQSEPSSYQSISGNGRIGYRDTWGSIRLSVGGELETHHNTSYYYDSLLEYRTPVNNINENWSMLASAGLYLPTSHNSQKNKLNAAPRLAGYVFYRPSPQWSVYLSPRVRYNAYQHKIGRQGEHFVEHRVDMLADITWHFSDHWYLDVSGSYAMAKKFNSSRYDNLFTATQEIGWEFAPQWIAAIGHNNSGTFYDPERGSSHGFEIYDKRSSVFYLSITKYL